MHMRQSSFLLAVVLLVPLFSLAQTADEIVAKALQARGGADKLKSLKSMRITGSVAIQGESMGFVQLQKRPNKLRQDLSVQGVTLLSRGFDGEHGWKKAPVQDSSESAVNVLQGQELEDFRTEADFDGILMGYKEKGYKLELSGKEPVDGKNAYRLKITMKDGLVRNIFIDAATFLEVKVAGTTQREGVAIDFELMLSDYRSVDGIMFPFSFEDRQLSGGAANQKLVLEKVEFNIAIDDSTFAVPAAASTPK
jgi:hypothetical protein